METAATGTWVHSTQGIPDWRNCPWHGFLECGIRTHHKMQAEVEIPKGPSPRPVELEVEITGK